MGLKAPEYSRIVLGVRKRRYTAAVQEKRKSDPRVAALTGEAIKLMAEAGASAEAMGHFAMHYPAIAASKLEPLPAPVEIDLELLMVAVRKVLGATDDARQAPVRGERGATRVKKNVTYQGKRTSVKIRAELLTRFQEKAGDAADDTLQAFVEAAPADHPNRSAFVEQQITNHLVLANLSVSPGIGQH